MRKHLLATTALFAATALSTAALAAGPTDSTGTMKEPIPSMSNDAANPATTPIPEAVDGVDGVDTPATMPQVDATDTLREPSSDEPITYGSVADRRDTFAGSVTGGLSVDELLGRDVVDSTGDTVGEISDLLIGRDDTVNQAVVDVGGFLGLGSKPVAIDISQVTFEQGDGGAIVVNLTEEQLLALPAVERNDDGWFTTR